MNYSLMTNRLAPERRPEPATAGSMVSADTRKRTSGFTLVELMIAVAIVGILAAVAYPAYMDSLVKSRRGAARACLTNYATHMERYYTTNMRYTDSGGSAPTLPSLDCASANESGRFYTYSFDGTPAASTFKLQAVPKGVQLSKDTACGTLAIDQTGARSVSTGASNVSRCW